MRFFLFRKAILLPRVAAMLLLALPATAQVEIVGLRSVTTAEAEKWIATQLEFVESSGVSMARADDLAFFLENSLRDRGFRSATVNWELVGETGTRRIVLTVDEGPSARVGPIEVRGNAEVEQDAIEELLLAATRKRLKLRPSDPVPYVAMDLENGRERLLDLYRILGYADAEVELARIGSSGQSGILVEIEQGPLYRVAGVATPEARDASMEASLRDLVEEFTGEPYSAAVENGLKTRMREIAIDAGYYNAEVVVERTEEMGPGSAGRPTAIRGIGGAGPRDPLSGTGEADGALAQATARSREVDLTILVDWGDPVVVDSIRVHGNEKVKDPFFDRHFASLRGAPYSPGATNAQVEELLKTGAFETVRTDLVEHPDGTTSLDIEVEEGKSRTLGVYGGFMTYEGPIGGFEFRNLNLLGSVRKIDAEIEFSRRGARGEVEVVDPWFFWTDYEMRAGLFAVNRMEEGYDRFSSGGRYGLSRRFGERQRNRFSVFGEAAFTEVSDSDISEAFLGETSYFSNMVGLSFSIDHRDNPVSPRRGWIAETSFGVASSALASEVEYVEAMHGVAAYYPVGDHTLRFRARTGCIQPIGDEESLPIDLRFFSGGASSVRSFEERRLGLIDPGSGHPVGGEFFTLFSLEYDIPIPCLNGFSVVPFADAGNLLPDADDAGFSDMRYAVGLGLHYLTPIGPLRIEYGLNPSPRDGESDGSVHIGFGTVR